MTLAAGIRLWSMAAPIPSGWNAVMDAKKIAETLADSLPETANPRDELIALGMVAAAVICLTDPIERADLVETFCGTLRKGVGSELN